jgi:Rps23 Pro-64 3,4-dihydroxylase Tpa1-like proline 4-hydroxylase
MSTIEELSKHIVTRLCRDRNLLAAEFNAPAETKTRHFVCDDLLPEPLARKVYGAFPPDRKGFRDWNTFRERKRSSVILGLYDPILTDITFAIQSPAVISEIAEITGIEALEPDPKLYAGGLSIMIRGDFLHPHIDNSHDSERQRYRRLNLLYYVSPEWTDECGGNFELWDESERVPKIIVSKFNRLVVMETNKSSRHSVNTVQCDRPRCCVSNYFFSKRSPSGEDYYHVTAFKARPGNLLSTAIFRTDTALRNVVAKLLRLQRGRNRIYRQK